MKDAKNKRPLASTAAQPKQIERIESCANRVSQSVCCFGEAPARVGSVPNQWQQGFLLVERRTLTNSQPRLPAARFIISDESSHPPPFLVNFESLPKFRVIT